VFASNRDIELRLRKNNLFAQYQELIYLRAEIARLLNPLKVSPPRARRNRRSAFRTPILFRDVMICARSHRNRDNAAAD
jgi:hypothetical protein